MAKPVDGSVRRLPASWAAHRNRSLCPICQRGRPRDVIAILAASWVSAPPVAPLPGYVAVVARRHVAEPFELPSSIRRAFWEDVTLAAKALSDLLSPTKMNYELHGNTIPHLHVHLYPRFADDPFVGGPIDPRVASFMRSRKDLLRISRAIREAWTRSPRNRKRLPAP